MKVTFLGTGTSHGVPVIACGCQVCQSEEQKDKRLRSSILVEIDNQVIVVDTGPDFRQQMLRANVKRLDAVLLTHEHKDHTAGFDDVRAFNFSQHGNIKVYSSERVESSIRKSFEYIFSGPKYPGIPKVEFHTIRNEKFHVGPTQIQPITVYHLHLPVQGFRFGDFVYITDANDIKKEEREKIAGCRTLVLNALRLESHISHFSLAEAIEMSRELGAHETYFTHISHQLGFHKEVEKKLPDGMHLAYDGLMLEF